MMWSRLISCRQVEATVAAEQLDLSQACSAETSRA